MLQDVLDMAVDKHVLVRIVTKKDGYKDHRDRLVAVVADLERKDHEAETVCIPVLEMLAELDRRGLENTSDNRAMIAASWRQE